MSPDGSPLAWSWVEHLRGGGSTPWAEFADPSGAQTGVPASTGHRAETGHRARRDVLPGAAQLEVVRLLAVRNSTVGHLLPDRFEALADRALHRSGPGRGQPDLPLLVPGRVSGEARVDVGAPPVDPADVPVDELVRVAVGLLADLTVGCGPLLGPEVPRRWWPARRGFHLAGAPVTTAGVRAALAAAGHLEGGRSPEVVLLARPLDAHLAEVWSSRVQHGAPVRWETFAGRWARRDALPPSADLPRIASFWAARVGAARVHVVASATDPLVQVIAVLGRKAPSRSSRPADVLPLSPEATDVLRRLSRVFNVRADDDTRAGLLRRVRSLVPDAPVRSLALPPARRDWADRRAQRMIGDIRAGGYSVHGDLDRIAPRHQGASSPKRPDVLTMVLDTCLRTAELEVGRMSR